MIMLVDSTFSDSCYTALKTLMNDISGDGWEIIRHDFPRTTTAVALKSDIANDYSTHVNVKSLLIIGHLAVPYSGLFDTINYPPDGHVPYHDGAWPADIYYSCVLGGGWTDVGTNTLGSYVPNQNSPGDGKWDQIPVPSTPLLQVSRFDFYNMPSFTTTEIQMMRSYLAKDHNYKMDSLAVVHRGLISDNFGYFGGEAFAANGWRNFAPLVGRDSVHVLPYESTLNTSSYQWSYGCGGGSFTSAGGIGNTIDFTTNQVNGIFTMLFGSYFGDWNVADNFLRAPLCSSNPALTNCWAGRPNWFFHHMALGDNIGYSTFLTFNNSGFLYQPTGYGNGWIHIALMGDLSLRTDYIKPVSNLTITTPLLSGAVLNWTASPDPAVIGYYVYRSDSLYGHYQLLNAAMLSSTTLTYHDLVTSPGTKHYQVRPVKLQSTPSGAYYNLGIGVADTAYINMAPLNEVTISPSIDLSIFPNPAENNLNVVITTDNPCIVTMFVMNVAGESLNGTKKRLSAGSNAYSLNVSGFAAGTYAVVINTGDKQIVKKWVKL